MESRAWLSRAIEPRLRPGATAPSAITVRDQGLLNARQFDIDSGLSTEDQEIKDLAGFYTNDYQK